MKRPSTILVTPIMRGDDEITIVELRRPSAGELRGLTVSDLIRMDVAAVVKLLPRISVPSITEAEAESLDPFNFSELAAHIFEFLTDRPKTLASEKTSPPEISSTQQPTSQSPLDGDPESSGSSTSSNSSSGGDEPVKS